MNCLIGYTGFVGNFLMNKLEFQYKFNSKNIHEIINYNYDTVYCCGISAMKWYANLHPEEDLENINKLLNYLKFVKCKKFILISTIDVYPENITNVNEDFIINYSSHAYGKNRLYVENEIKKIFNDYHIIRLPGLFGFGLKKNIIFDMLNNKKVVLNLDSKFQWYDMNDIFSDIEYVINNNIKLINLFPEPITNQELLKIINTNFEYSDKIINYDIQTKYNELKYWYPKEKILSSLENYVNIIFDKPS